MRVTARKLRTPLRHVQDFDATAGPSLGSVNQEIPMAAATTKSPVDQFTAAGNKAFKELFEKSLGAIAELNAHSKKNLEAVVASVTAATKGVETLGAHAVAFSKKAVEDQVAAAKTLASAKSVQEVVELQTAFAKTALENYMAEMNKMAETVSASVKELVTPLNERVTALVEHSKPRAESASESLQPVNPDQARTDTGPGLLSFAFKPSPRYQRAP